MEYGLHWFRRDLRIKDNPALNWSLHKHEGRVIGLFCFDSTFLTRPDFSHNRFGFFLKTLEQLQREYRSFGGDLLVIDEIPLRAFDKLMSLLQSQKKWTLKTVTFNRDYEPFARERDQKVTELLEKKFELSVHTESDHLIIEPTQILKQDGTPYRVYTAFKNEWLKLYKPKVSIIEKPQVLKIKLKDILGAQQVDTIRDSLKTMLQKTKASVPLPHVGFEAANKQLLNWDASRYEQSRDYPSKQSGSGLSIYFKNGSFTTRHALTLVKNKSRKFLEEIIWREFYYSILYHFPSVEQEAFKTSFRGVTWPNDEKLFYAWKNGKTGFPLIDAGMRELLATGRMHNRVRMAVASFLVKDLLVDWRLGERFFMQHLLDGDLAANNGGWQWCASSGCDSQPYFRVFNPLLQSKRFDSDGVYIKQWVPELRNVQACDLHALNKLPSEYIKPIVDRNIQRQKREAFFARIKKI